MISLADCKLLSVAVIINFIFYQQYKLGGYITKTKSSIFRRFSDKQVDSTKYHLFIYSLHDRGNAVSRNRTKIFTKQKSRRMAMYLRLRRAIFNFQSTKTISHNDLKYSTVLFAFSKDTKCCLK